MLNKIFTWIGIVGAILVIPASLLYTYEKNLDVAEFYEYYGYVTEFPEYKYPAKITSFTFGYSEGPLKIKFINRLYCADLGSSDAKELISSRVKVVKEFEFKNKLPGFVVDSIDADSPTSQIGRRERDRIRYAHVNGENFDLWDMGDIRPAMNSLCNVTADVLGYTKWFRIPKRTVFDGNDFLYTVPFTSSLGLDRAMQRALQK